MFNSNHPFNILQSALELPCGITIKNRIAKSPMSDSLADGEGNPTSASLNPSGKGQPISAASARLIYFEITPMDRLKHKAIWRRGSLASYFKRSSSFSLFIETLLVVMALLDNE